MEPARRARRDGLGGRRSGRRVVHSAGRNGRRPGLLLAAVATVGLALAALYGTRARPRLVVDADGVTVGGLAGRRHLPWSQVGAVRAQAVRRWGRDSVMLEMDVVDADGTERMLVFGKLDLGDDPEDVAEAVCAARPATPPH